MVIIHMRGEWWLNVVGYEACDDFAHFDQPLKFITFIVFFPIMKSDFVEIESHLIRI